MSRRLDPNEIAKALGADRHFPLHVGRSGGPLDLLHLRHEVQQRLRSSGGRPSDPRWSTKRLVPFEPTCWKRLEALADKITETTHRVSPGQLAAILIETSLARIEKHLGVVEPEPRS